MNGFVLPPPKAVFFDVDDTLYDHLIPFREALMHVLGTGDGFPYAPAYHRMRYYSDTLSAQAGGTPTQGRALHEMRTRRFILSLAEFGLELSAAQAAEVQAEYLSRQFDIRLFDGARSLISDLLGRECTVGLITNGPSEHQMKKIAALGLADLIPPELIYISGAVGFTKPDRRLFAHVADKLNFPPEACYYIGDSWRNDVVGALDAGWHVLWFNHRNAQPESEHKPHFRANSYEELRQLLLPSL
ncbi:HAD family hydrolase [Paenibacillus sp. M1]|uniref:HAD family hydrolase n=1 Tax=Paenibacillus haidiansis TaxID=1574488 RepID=A0ABU7VVW8_9BACL